jgi:hypothetical protein
VQFVDDSTFSQYTLGSPVVLNGPGDILIGVVNRSAGADAGEFPAALDQTTSSGRSWAGVYNAGNPGNPPTLPADNIWGTIDSLNYPGNWLVRGVGTTDAACSSASDIPWLSVTPTSGTIFPAGSDNVTVTFDSAGLSEGSYSGHLCLTCNDPLEPLVAVPVSLTVNLPLIFVDGFEEGDMEAWSDTVQ